MRIWHEDISLKEMNESIQDSSAGQEQVHHLLDFLVQGVGAHHPLYQADLPGSPGIDALTGQE